MEPTREGAVTVRVLRLPHAEGLDLPRVMTAHAAAADIVAAVDQPLSIAPGDIALVPTGLVFEIPIGWEIQIRPRSGLALKHGITLINSPATIDADYRGEIRIAIVNLGREPFTVTRGMRIAQLLPAKVTAIVWEEAETLSQTARGEGGFGHSGT